MWVGLLFVAFSLLYLRMKLHVSYTSAGGSIGMVPVLDGAVFPPIGMTFGLVMLRCAQRLGTGDWIYFVFWIVATVLAFWAINHVGNLGERDNRY
jgi:hypothetical protein